MDQNLPKIFAATVAILTLTASVFLVLELSKSIKIPHDFSFGSFFPSPTPSISAKHTPTGSPLPSTTKKPTISPTRKPTAKPTQQTKSYPTPTQTQFEQEFWKQWNENSKKFEELKKQNEESRKQFCNTNPNLCN
jgi:hypothetical protein